MLNKMGTAGKQVLLAGLAMGLLLMLGESPHGSTAFGWAFYEFDSRR